MLKQTGEVWWVTKYLYSFKNISIKTVVTKRNFTIEKPCRKKVNISINRINGHHVLPEDKHHF